MGYTKQTWSTGIAGGTPLSATRLNYIETGLQTAAALLDTHIASTTSVHGISNAANLVYTTDTRLSDTRTPSALSVVNSMVSNSAAIAESKLSLASDAAAGTASRRTLGTGATQAAAGNDSRFTDTRVPTDASVTNAKVHATAAIARTKLDFGSGLVNADIAADAAIAESKVAFTDDADVSVASRRTLGTGAQQAAAGNDTRFSDARTPSDNSVTTAKIVDGNVTQAKMGITGWSAPTGTSTRTTFATTTVTTEQLAERVKALIEDLT